MRIPMSYSHTPTKKAPHGEHAASAKYRGVAPDGGVGRWSYRQAGKDMAKASKVDLVKAGDVNRVNGGPYRRAA